MSFDSLFVDSKLPQPFLKQELNDMFLKMENGDLTAREEIIRHNIKLVINEVMKKFYNCSLDKKELVSVGLIGLIKSIDTFDLNKGVSFSNYSIKCIDNEILMFMKKEKRNINNVSIDGILEKNQEENNTTRYKNKLYDENADFVLAYEKRECYKIIRKMVFSQPKKNSEILQKYFGFQSDSPMSQEEIAKTLGISQSYISRVIRNSLKIMRLDLQETGIIETTNKENSKQKVKVIHNK